MDRTQQNLARKKSYQKKRYQDAWRGFEWHCVKYHHEKYGHIVWHWDMVPESELYNSGFIHDYNEHRLKRLAQRKERITHNLGTEYQNLHSDIGFDGLVYDPINNIYHGLQAKYWHEGYLRPDDLGTFLMKIIELKYRNPASVGYLYHTSKLTIPLFESCQLKNGIISEKLEYQLLDGRSKKSISESKFCLKSYQTKAIDEYVKCPSNIKLKLINMICGTGKTIVAGHCLAKTHPNLVICIAPFKLHVDNLLKRIPPFLKNYEILLVDSDIYNNGTTDECTIRRFLQKTNKRILFSTFASAKNILSRLMDHDDYYEYILVDEVHNITPKWKKLRDFVNKFSNGLLLTATPYRSIAEIIDCTNIYTYNLRDAINDKAVCDYMVYLPLCTSVTDNGVTDNRVTTYLPVCEIPFEFSDLDEETTQQSLFLAKGLLQTGSRNCVVFCKDKKHCKMFKSIFRKILRKYHGLECNIDIIIENTPYDRRDKILQRFKTRCKHDHIINIVVSIKILDEAVDMPFCDSEFVTHVGVDNDIRMVQRLMRGGRIVDDNPNKVNNLFIWTTDLTASLDIFCLLKSSDPSFSKKIRVISSNYDTQTKRKNIKLQDKKTLELVNFIDKIKCKTYQDIWLLRLDRWNYNVDTKGYDDRNKDDRSSYRWERLQQQSYRENKLSNERIKILDENQYWKWDEDTKLEDWIERLEKIKRKIIKYNKLPSKRSKDGRWMSYQRSSYKYKRHNMANNSIYYQKWTEFVCDDNFSTYFYDFQTRWECILQSCKTFIKNEKQAPPVRTFQGRWILRQCKNYESKTQIMSDPDIRQKWKKFIRKYGDYLNNKDKRDKTWFVNMDKIKEYLDTHSKRPLQSSPLGKFLSHQINNYNNQDKNMKIGSEQRNIFEQFISEYNSYFTSYSDKWLATLINTENWLNSNRRKPLRSSSDIVEARNAKWISRQKSHHTHKQGMLKDDNIRKRWELFIENYGHYGI